MYVYFVRIGDNGPVKVGIAKTVEKRLAGLQVSCPEKINLMGKIEFKNADEAVNKEKMLHKLFWQYRMSGEWFYPSERVIKTIYKFLEGEDFGDLYSWDEAIELEMMETVLGEHIQAIFNKARELVEENKLEAAESIQTVLEGIKTKIKRLIMESKRKQMYFNKKYYQPSKGDWDARL